MKENTIGQSESLEYGRLCIIDGVFVQNITIYQGGIPIGIKEEKYIIKNGKLELVSEK